MKRAAVAVVIVCLPIIAGVALAMDSAHKSHRKTVRLLGNPHVMSKLARQPAGSAEIFPFVSRTNGTATAVRIYVDRRNRSTKLFVGVYLYRHGRPGRRLRYARLSRPHAGHWNSVNISRADIRPGHRYGISVLGRGGPLYFRNRTGNSCHGAQADQMSVKALPASWGASHRHSACAISAYVVGNRSSARPTKPAGSPAGTTVVNPVPTGAPAPIVGSLGEPAVACSTTLTPGADVQGALATTSPGGVVCLNAGNWAAQTLTGLSPASPGVTLAAAPGAIGQVDMAGITTTGTVSNLTVEGLNMTEGASLHAAGTNDTFQYNTMENWGSGSSDAQLDAAFLLYPYSGSQSGFIIQYNQIDHVPQCLQDDGQDNVTFSHNVCGPGIGNGGETDVHYTQEEGGDNVRLDNNAFEGPVASTATTNGSHVNVAHFCGNNIQFNNNIVWRSNAVAQTVLMGDDCTVTGGQANNNLILEASSPYTYSLWIDNAHNSSNVEFSNNTVVGATGFGGFISQIGNAFTAHNNLAADDANNAYGGFDCANCSANAADDGTGSVSWRPAWQSTAWTPNSGSPWGPPPTNYYKPSSIASSFGYQGTIGP